MKHEQAVVYTYTKDCSVDWRNKMFVIDDVDVGRPSQRREHVSYVHMRYRLTSQATLIGHCAYVESVTYAIVCRSFVDTGAGGVAWSTNRQLFTHVPRIVQLIRGTVSIPI